MEQVTEDVAGGDDSNTTDIDANGASHKRCRWNRYSSITDIDVDRVDKSQIVDKL